MPKTKKSTKKVISRSKVSTPRSSFSFFKNKLVLIAGLVIVAVLGFKAIMGLVAQPAGVNEVANSRVSGNMPAPSGCTYQQVQCVKAPCEPILSCPPGATATPTPTATPAANPPKNCLSWFDGCNTCSVQAGKLTGCTKKACKDVTQKPYCVKYMDELSPDDMPLSCTCPPGAKCKLDPRCNTPAPTLLPTPTPSTTTSCIPQIKSLSFQTNTAIRRCDGNTYSVANYACFDANKKGSLNINGCLSAKDILIQVQAICGNSCTVKK